jgi:flagellar biosynthetic protein FlhB
MAESESGQEKTEEPSGRKLQKSREQGQVPRSKEVASFILLCACSLFFIFYAQYFTQFFTESFMVSLQLTREELMSQQRMALVLFALVQEGALLLTPFFLITAIFSVIGTILLGGFNFSLEPIMPKLSKLNPLAGLKKMVSKKSWVEMLKALFKFFLISGMALGILYMQVSPIMHLASMPLNSAIAESLSILGWSFFWVSFSLIVIAMVDAPLQWFFHHESLKMTKQEVTEENKNTEGNPEVKGRIRQIQYRMAEARMMKKIPEADVIITNPDHYSVALKYDPKRASAPFVIAKGVDGMAFRIRDIAKHHKVPILEAPPLARSIYHTTKIDQQIPMGLYLSVAQVLAYVHQLKTYQKGHGKKPIEPKTFDIPQELKH